MKRLPITADRELIYASPEIQKVINNVNIFARHDVPVLIRGDNGTGKENIAHLLHQGSARKGQPLLALNCAAISPHLVESELFGHEKGAFTGAVARRMGAFEAARDGTIFLDEIGDMPMEMQTKLLRVLQDGQFTRVGGTETLTARPRIIAATNKNLEEAVEAGTFRKDLYYRLKGVELCLPNLKDRPQDIPVLAEYFAQKAQQTYNLPHPPTFSPDSLEILSGHDWPGNVRELQNVVTVAAIRAQDYDGRITPEMLALPSRGKTPPAPAAREPADTPAAAPAPHPPAMHAAEDTPAAAHAPDAPAMPAAEDTPVAARAPDAPATPRAAGTPVAPALSVVEDSFGFHLCRHREARGLTQTALAEQVSRRTSRSERVTREHVYDWEQNAAVPEQDILHALAYLLIADTPQSTQEKADGIEAFFKAAETTRRRLSDPTSRLTSPDSFACTLTTLRERARLTQTQLATRVTRLLGERIALDQQALYFIETGHPDHELTPAEALALTLALDTPKHRLSDPDRVALYVAAGEQLAASRERQNLKTPSDLLKARGEKKINITQLAINAGVHRITLSNFLRKGPTFGTELRLLWHIDKERGPLDALQFMRMMERQYRRNGRQSGEDAAESHPAEGAPARKAPAPEKPVAQAVPTLESLLTGNGERTLEEVAAKTNVDESVIEELLKGKPSTLWTTKKLITYVEKTDGPQKASEFRRLLPAPKAAGHAQRLLAGAAVNGASGVNGHQR